MTRTRRSPSQTHTLSDTLRSLDENCLVKEKFASWLTYKKISNSVRRHEKSNQSITDFLCSLFVPFGLKTRSYVGQWGWLNFRGEWGNTKNGCDLEPISGECRLNHGPIFPGGPDDMPPPRIQRSRQASTVPPARPSIASPHYLAYTPTVPPIPRLLAPAARASSLLNYRYKRRDPESSSVSTVVANMDEPVISSVTESETEPAIISTDRLVNSAPEDFVASTTIAMMTI